MSGKSCVQDSEGTASQCLGSTGTSGQQMKLVGYLHEGGCSCNGQLGCKQLSEGYCGYKKVQEVNGQVRDDGIYWEISSGIY